MTDVNLGNQKLCMWRLNPEFSLGYSNSWTIIEAQGNACLHLQNPCTKLHTCLGAAGKVSPSKTMQHIHVKDSFSKVSMHHSPSWTALGQNLQHTPRLPSLQVVALLFLLNTAARQIAAPAALHLACSTLSASSMGSSITPAATHPFPTRQHGLGQLLQHCWTPSSTPPAAAPSS
jgi:hypothetical protein